MLGALSKTVTFASEGREVYRVIQKTVRDTLNLRRRDRQERPVTAGRLALLRRELGVKDAWLISPGHRLAWNLPTTFVEKLRGDAAASTAEGPAIAGGPTPSGYSPPPPNAPWYSPRTPRLPDSESMGPDVDRGVPEGGQGVPEGYPRGGVGSPASVELPGPGNRSDVALPEESFSGPGKHDWKIASARRALDPYIFYPDGTVAVRETGHVVWRKGDDPVDPTGAARARNEGAAQPPLLVNADGNLRGERRSSLARSGFERTSRGRGRASAEGRVRSAGGSSVPKRGEKVTHHFAHPASSSCSAALESEAHRQAKLGIQMAVSALPGCRASVESPVGDSRPDVLLKIRSTTVAVEVQRSTISREEIRTRTSAYAELAIPVVWVVCLGDLSITAEVGLHSEFDGREWVRRPYSYLRARTTEQERFLHGLFFGRLYAHVGLDYVLPIHFDPEEEWVNTDNVPASVRD